LEPRDRAGWGAVISNVHVPQHAEVDPAVTSVLAEGALAIFKTGFYGAFSRTYYPSSVITAINQMWSTHADALSPRTKLSLIAAEFSRRTYHGRVYAKAHNARSSFIRAYDAALADVDVLDCRPACNWSAGCSMTDSCCASRTRINIRSIGRA
jgi:amidase